MGKYVFMKAKIRFPDHLSNFCLRHNITLHFIFSKKGGSKIETEKRMMQMFLFGGTIGWSRTPMFHIGNSQRNHVTMSSGFMLA